MGRMKAFALAFGHFVMYGLSLKLATGFAQSAIKLEIPNYDWFILFLIAFGISVMAFFQEADKKWSKALGGFLKYVLLAIYTYSILIMSSYIKATSGNQTIVAEINWGLWIYVLITPTLINAILQFAKPFVEEE